MKNLIISAVVAAIVAVIVVMVGGNNQPAPDLNLGASGTRFPNGISADTTSPTMGQVRGTTFTATGDSTFGGGINGINVTTTNTATSSLIVGCVQSYATSTASPIRLSATTTASGGTIALWVFGSCSAL